ncbi:hypothetical protein ANCCAN_28002 [Ancylostoma caninum]|uniref:Uncharacterized protein n=1 Tax=Ancylostoma caninum TaxID=29170 RepID=A0A368F2J7_ANCCA|nr:hypothetical protein ANCCAN_28002 [Ancylostoma caninum]
MVLQRRRAVADTTHGNLVRMCWMIDYSRSFRNRSRRIRRGVQVAVLARSLIRPHPHRNVNGDWQVAIYATRAAKVVSMTLHRGT